MSIKSFGGKILTRASGGVLATSCKNVVPHYPNDPRPLIDTWYTAGVGERVINDEKITGIMLPNQQYKTRQTNTGIEYLYPDKINSYLTMENPWNAIELQLRRYDNSYYLGVNVGRAPTANTTQAPKWVLSSTNVSFFSSSISDIEIIPTEQCDDTFAIWVDDVEIFSRSYSLGVVVREIFNLTETFHVTVKTNFGDEGGGVGGKTYCIWFRPPEGTKDPVAWADNFVLKVENNL